MRRRLARKVARGWYWHSQTAIPTRSTSEEPDQQKPCKNPALRSRRTSLWLIRPMVFVFLVFVSSVYVHGQATAAKPKEGMELERKQKELVQKLQKLEETFLRMSELEAVSNPTHSGLLLQAAQLSKQLGTRQRLLSASELLAKGQLSKAIQEQESAQENLKKLLELLQSENRSTRVREERARLEDILKDLLRMENIQRSIRGRTESGQDLNQAKSDQNDLSQQLSETEKTLDTKAKETADKERPDKKDNEKGGDKDELLDKRDGNEDRENQSDKDHNSGKMPGQKGEDSDNQSTQEPSKSDESNENGENPDADGKKPDKKSNDKNRENEKSNGKKPDDSPNKDDDNKTDKPASESSENQQEKESSNNNKSPDSDASESDPSDAGKPLSREQKALDRVQKAQNRMKKAVEQLEKSNREEAVEEQMEAEKELRDAVAELEKILRQLREEEIERSLVDLETRLRRMNEMEKSIREETGRLDKLEGDARDRTLDIQANKLSIEQSKVVMEGQRALLLLQDEGSSTAFPEALTQIIKDSQMVVKRLSSGNVTASTQAIEDEILFALEELLDSLKQVQKKREENKRQGTPGEQGDSQEQPLVDNLAELKLLKTLQLRVNRRTQSMAQQVDKVEDPLGQIQNPDLLLELQDLATRQQTIYDVTREILLKNAQK